MAMTGNPEELAPRARLLLAFKTALITLLVGGAAFAVFRGSARDTLSGSITALIITEYVLCLGAYIVINRASRFLGLYWMVFTAVDLAVTTVLLLLTGGVDSIYTVLYLVALLSAAFVLDTRLTGIFWLSSLFLYFIVVFFSFQGKGPDKLPSLIIRAALYVSALSSVGFLSVSLVRRLQETERLVKEGQRRLSRMEVNHRRVLEVMGDPVIIVDGQLSVAGYNERAESFFGEQIGEGINFGDLIPWFSADGPPLQQGTMTKGGRQYHLELVCSPYEVAGREGKVIVVRDRTELVEMEREMERKERMAAIGRLASTLAHELRNPMASIRGSMELLFMVEEPDERHRLRDIVFREIDRLDSLVSDLLTYARERDISPTAHDLSRLVDETFFLLLQDPLTSGRTLTTDGESVRAMVDPAAFRQILMNLVRNSLEACSESAVRVSVSLDGDWAVVRVHDDGPGISPEILDKIFEPFFTTREKGTGLGLAVVKTLMERMGGRITLEDSEQGVTWRLEFVAASDQVHDRTEKNE